STVAGVLIASADSVSSVVCFFAPHAKKKPSTHVRKIFLITIRDWRRTILFIGCDPIESERSISSPIFAVTPVAASKFTRRGERRGAFETRSLPSARSLLLPIPIAVPGFLDALAALDTSHRKVNSH